MSVAAPTTEYHYEREGWRWLVRDASGRELGSGVSMTLEEAMEQAKECEAQK